jgi:enhancing lycopene biosynthesis protein 2
MTRSKTVGLILSGCGHMDGSEIRETVLCNLALEQLGAKVRYYAPNLEFSVTDHLTQHPTGESRNILTESARIARCRIQDLSEAKSETCDVWILPGGYGAAKNLCTFADLGTKASINPKLERILDEAYSSKKPLAACCIAPVVLALFFGKKSIQAKLTIGNDPQTTHALEQLGMLMVNMEAHEVCIDDSNRVVTTPAYMLETNMPDVYRGIYSMCSNALNLV